MKGKSLSEEHRRKIAESLIGRPELNEKNRLSHLGKKHSLETLKKMSEAQKGEKSHMFGKFGERHHLWIKDRSKLAKRQERNDTAYIEWRQQVWLRDNNKCKIANPDCAGRIEAHHILGWTDYPELRYQLNNGITLCHAHHPRRRSDEKRLSPYFQQIVTGLVSVSRDKNWD